MKRICIFFLFVLLGQTAYGQGVIKGLVYDAKAKDILPTATVMVDSSQKGVRTGMDGTFSLELPAGTYNLRVSFVGFEPQLINGVEVADGLVTNLDTVKIGITKETQLQGAVVTAKLKPSSENAFLKLKQISSNVIDGMTASSFRKIGDGDAAASIKRVSGVSVNDGKYVFVRGLGDRYTKTMLNNLDVPGLDPDRNTIQMDIFPTGIIDNLVINKSFSADLPADFTGGLVNISLKDIPSEKSANIGLSLGYNPNMHFQSDYLSYHGGKTDFLGFDDGTREIPATENIPSFVDALGNQNSAKRFADILESFNPEMAAYEKNSGMNMGMKFYYGNQKVNESKNKTIGYNFLVDYDNKTQFYREVEYARYGLESDPNVLEMEQREYQKGDLGRNSVMLSLMGGYAIKKENSNWAFKLIHLQNGESQAGIFDYNKSDQGTEFQGFQHNLEYTQRGLTNLLVAYDKKLNDRWKMEWKLSPTYSTVHDPDIRYTRYVERGGAPTIGTEGGLPQRIWRELSEMNVSTKVDFTNSRQMFGRDAKIKTGAAYTFKDRSFLLRSFFINPKPASQIIDLTGNPDELFYHDNLWPNQERPDMGVIYQADFIPTNPNDYQSNVHNLAAYGSVEAHLNPKLKTILGLRLEDYMQYYTGQNQLGTQKLNNDQVLNDLGLYPALNMVYEINKKSNLRFSASRTTARPSMKELSYAEIYDPLTGRRFIGGMLEDRDVSTGTVYWDGQLRSTKIINLDLRWEVFPSLGNTISMGAFYKQLSNPIEMVQSSKQAGAFQPRNVGDGSILGAEIELRKDLSFISESMKKWMFTTNLTYTDSKIKYSSTEKLSREQNKRSGQTIGDSRQMAGQSPYMINAGMAYSTEQIEAGLYYNVQGPTLKYVGIVDRPDIFTQPFNSLNFNGTVKLGAEKNYTIGVKVSNILGDEREEFFQSYEAQEQIFTRYRPGRLYSFSIGYDF